MINYSASIKISQLNQLTGSNVTLDDFIPVVDSGSMTTKRLSLSELKSGIFNSASLNDDKSVVFQYGTALSASKNLKFDYTNNILSVTGSISASSVTASLAGTASRALTASLADTASYVVASTSTNAVSSSYVSASNSVFNKINLSMVGQKNYPFATNSGGDTNGIFLTSTSSTKAALAELYFAPSGSASGNNDYSNNVGIWLNGIYSGTTDKLPIYLGGQVTSTTPTPNICINTNGYVGINTFIPEREFSVVGSMNIDHTDINDGTYNIGSIHFGSGSRETIASARTLLSQNRYGLDFYTSASKRLSITNDGNVGIGTATPSSLLTVNGLISASKLSIGSGNGVNSNSLYTAAINGLLIIYSQLGLGANDWGFLYTSGSQLDNQSLYIGTADNGNEAIHFINRHDNIVGTASYDHVRFSLEPHQYTSSATKATVYGDLLVRPDMWTNYGGAISASSITASLAGTASYANSIPKYLMPSAWAYLSGSIGSNLVTQSNSSYNIISASRAAQGKYIIYFQSGALSNSNYSINIHPDDTSLTGNGYYGTFSVWNIKRNPLSCSFSCSVHSETVSGTPDYRDISSADIVVYSY